MRLKDYIVFLKNLITKYGSSYSRIAPTHIVLYEIETNKKLGIIEIEQYLNNPIDFRTKDFFSKRMSADIKKELEELEIISINGSAINTIELYLNKP